MARILGSRPGSFLGVAEAWAGDSDVQEYWLYKFCQVGGKGKQGWISGEGSIIQGKESRTGTRKHCYI